MFSYVKQVSILTKCGERMKCLQWNSGSSTNFRLDSSLTGNTSAELFLTSSHHKPMRRNFRKCQPIITYRRWKHFTTLTFHSPGSLLSIFSNFLWAPHKLIMMWRKYFFTRGDWGNLEIWGTLRQACLTRKLLCDLCAIWSMVPKLTNFHFPPYIANGCWTSLTLNKLVHFYIKSTFLGWSIFGSIDHVGP